MVMQIPSFNIIQGNPLAAYQAGANVGLAQQRNRMAQLQEARAQRAEQRDIAQVDQATRLRAVQDTARLARHVAGLPAEQQQAAWTAGLWQLERVYPGGPSSLPQTWDTGILSQLAPFEQAGPKAPGSYQEYQLAAAQGYPGSYTDFLTTVKRQPGTTINLGGPSEGLADRPLTSEEAARLNIPEENRTDFIVTSKGEIERRPTTIAEDEAARATARREVGEGSLAQAISNYRSSAGSANTIAGYVPPGPQREALSQQRQALVALVAKNILGTPGAEPSPALYQQAEELVPDFSDPIDRANLPTMLDTLDQMLLTKQREEAQTTALDDGPGPTRVAVDGDVARISTDEEYDALPSGAQFVGPDGVMREKP